MSDRRRPPRIPPEDADLWRRVTRDVRPLRPRGPEPGTGEPAPVPPAEPEAVGATEKPPRADPVPARARAARARRGPPPPAALDPRISRGLARGRLVPDAVLDLHGLREAQAHDRLLAFLREGRARGNRLVLVVTGKGREGGEGDWWEQGERGVLRRAVPKWLATPEFRELVAGFAEAHERGGGGGALHIHLRRPRAERAP